MGSEPSVGPLWIDVTARLPEATRDPLNVSGQRWSSTGEPRSLSGAFLLPPHCPGCPHSRRCPVFFPAAFMASRPASLACPPPSPAHQSPRQLCALTSCVNRLLGPQSPQIKSKSFHLPSFQPWRAVIPAPSGKPHILVLSYLYTEQSSFIGFLYCRFGYIPG